MKRHPVIAGVSLVLGALSLVVTAIGVGVYGQPLLNWASLSNVTLGCGLVAAGVLLWTGHRLGYVIGICAWLLLVVISAVDLAGFLWWRVSQGPKLPWHLSVRDIIYIVVGYQVLRTLIVERRAQRSATAPEGGSNAA